MHQTWEARGKVGLIAQPPFLHRAGLEVLNNDVGVFQQAQQHLPPLLAPQIKRDALLVAVHPEVIARIAIQEWRPPTAGFIALRRLDLDHFGAVIGQNHRAIRATQNTGEVDDFQARKCACGGRDGHAAFSWFWSAERPQTRRQKSG